MIRIAACLILFFASAAQAQTAGPSLEIRRLAVAPVIDGVLEDNWKNAVVAPGLTQFQPREGAPVTEEDVVYLGYDNDNLYAAFVAKDSRVDLIRANLARREDIFTDDFIGLIVDTFGDRRRAYEFFANPLGVQADAINNSGSEDSTPDFVWYSKGKLTADGYVVEMKIPFKSLRFSAAAKQPWRIYVFRNIQRKNEKDLWPPYYSNRGDMLSQSAALTGLKDIGSSSKFDIIPEFTAARVEPRAPLTAAAHLGEVNLRLGANLRYGLTPAWTLSAALNPDFSQVETDSPQITVNQRYAIYTPEKRPFFMEDADIFLTPINVNNTRTIADPGYGLKLTGKQGLYTAGALMAEDRANGGAKVEIARFKTDIGQDSSLGFIYSGREAFSGDYNRVSGLDGNFKLDETHTLQFQSLGGYTGTSAGRDIGQASDVNLSKSSRELSWTLEYDDISPDFQTQNGYITRSNVREGSAFAGYKFWQEKGALQYWSLSSYYSRSYSHAGLFTDEDLYVKGSLMFPKQTSLSLTYRPNTLERYCAVAFRKQYATLSFYSELSKFLAISADLTAGDGINYSPYPFLGDRKAWNLSFTLKPFARLQLTQTLLNSRLNKKSGERVFNENLWETKLSMQWTKEASSRLVYHYSTLSHCGFADALVSWVLTPGTAAYLGYDVNFAADGGPLARTTETLFTKVSYLFRL